MVYITRRERFNAAHRLFREDWTDDKNLNIFGKCSNPNWHGHNYTLFVTVKGNVSNETGFVVNLKDLSNLIKSRIIDNVDHKNLNMDVDFLKGVIPTAENIAVGIWGELESKIDEGKLYSIKLYETENNYIEYKGE